MRKCLLIAGCCAVLAACGGDDEQGASESATPIASPTETASGGTSEREWADRVNAVCVENQRAVRKVADDVRTERLGRRAATAEVLERSLPIQRRLLDRLSEVPAPEELQGEFDGFVGRLRDTLPLFREFSAAVSANRNDHELTTRLIQVAAETRPFATEHDLVACLPDAK